MTAVGWTLLVGGVLVGLIIGSFTNVVIDRLPLALEEPNEFGESWDTRPWGEVLGGRSRCSACGAPVRAVDNIPVVSYLVLRGRCRSCHEPYGGFHPLVELAVPAVGLLVTWGVLAQDRSPWTLMPFLVLVPAGIAITVIDYRTLIVPTRLVWPVFGATVVLSGAATLLAAGGDPEWLLAALVGVAVMAGPLFVLFWFLPTAMGFGDIRLCTLLGWNVGFAAGSAGFGLGPAVFLAAATMAVSAALGLVIGIPVALATRGGGGSIRKAKVPWGPSLVMAAFLAVALAGPVLEPFG